MSWMLISLCFIIFFSSEVKMSLMSLKISVIWSLFFGVAGYLATIMFSGMSRLEALSVLNTSDISTLEFVEQLIMYAYFFSGALLKKILDYYPGLMLLAPVCVFAYHFVGQFPGMDFTLVGAMVGCIVFSLSAGFVVLLRYLAANLNVFYKTVLVATLVNILFYGLL